MRFSCFVALRYFFSKKSLNIIHIISLISLVGIGVSTMALLIVLSVFNGFTQVASDMLSYSNPDLIIESKNGKSIRKDSIDLAGLSRIKEMESFSAVVKESALLTCGENQRIVKMMGIDDNYVKVSAIDTTMRIGQFELKNDYGDKSILGYALTIDLGLGKGAEKMNIPLKFYVPKREGRVSIVPEESLNSKKTVYGGSFCTSSEIDKDFAFVPLEFAQDLLDFDKNQISSLHIKLKEGSNADKTKEKIREFLPEGMQIKNRLEQDPLYHKVVKAEKFAIYCILSFIIFIASFNIMGMLSLLMMVKERDILILRAIGAGKNSIKRIFFLNGLLLGTMGTLAGLFVGGIFCWLQSEFGLIKIGPPSFIIESFPVQVNWLDVVLIFFMSIIITGLCISMTVRKIKFEKRQ